MTTWITICDTCKREGWEDGDVSLTDGERLAERVEALAREGNPGAVRTRRHSCLMGCRNGCNVSIQAAGKICYSLGGFEPGAEAARAILDYAGLHAGSESGVVPYRSWPEGVKGRFTARHPPLPEP